VPYQYRYDTFCHASRHIIVWLFQKGGGDFGNPAESNDGIKYCERSQYVRFNRSSHNAAAQKKSKAKTQRSTP